MLIKCPSNPNRVSITIPMRVLHLLIENMQSSYLPDLNSLAAQWKKQLRIFEAKNTKKTVNVQASDLNGINRIEEIQFDDLEFDAQQQVPTRRMAAPPDEAVRRFTRAIRGIETPVHATVQWGEIRNDDGERRNND